MIPFIQSGVGVVDIVNNIMGKDNYFLYVGGRGNSDAPIYEFRSEATKDLILDRCRAFGVPYIYGMANPTSFTDAELKDIVNALHKEGYWIAFAGCYVSEAQSQRLFNLGFDISGSGWAINDFPTGNLCNLSADVDYSDFSTDGTVSDNLLTLAEEETLAPATTIQSQFLSGGSLHIVFKGTIHLKMGDYINEEFTSDGGMTMWFSTYFMNQSPTFLITARTSTEILGLDYKASKM
jgi:hypothetical protein